jgi:hypothetical protein
MIRLIKYADIYTTCLNYIINIAKIFTTVSIICNILLTKFVKVFLFEPKSINWKHKFKILMASVEDYGRQWTKREKEDLYTLSEWVKSVSSLIQIIIKKLMSTRDRTTSIFKDPIVAKRLSLLHDKHVIVSADKAPNNIVCVCRSHYIDCLTKELGIDLSISVVSFISSSMG